VYIDQGYLTEDMADISYLRWLYTAFTRTSEQVFLVNWPKEQQKLVVEEEEVE
jgi:exodeoxyribonuclease-5